MLYRFFHSKKGFTTMELLTVVVVLGILTAIAVPVFGAGLKNQKQKDCRNQCVVIQSAVQQAMVGMMDNGRKQETISIATWPDGPNKVHYNPDAGHVKLKIDDSYKYTYYTPLNDKLTLGQIRGGYNPDYTKESCELTGKYLKKKIYEKTPFYSYLANMEIPVCPFADYENDTTEDDYVYCIFWDGTVYCTCPQCNE